MKVHPYCLTAIVRHLLFLYVLRPCNTFLGRNRALPGHNLVRIAGGELPQKHSLLLVCKLVSHSHQILELEPEALGLHLIILILVKRICHGDARAGVLRALSNLGQNTKLMHFGRKVPAVELHF